MSGKEMSPYPGVTIQEHSFVLGYLMTHNVKDAAKKASISVPTAKEWLKKQPIKRMILSKAKEIEQVADVTIAECVNELKKIAFFDHKDYLKDFNKDFIELKDFEDMDTSGIQSMNVKLNAKGDAYVEIKPYNKIEALKELLLHLKGYQGPSSVHLHINEETAKNLTSQEISAEYHTIVSK